MKTLNNTDVNGAKNQVKDIEVFGNVDLFQLICKASSKAEGWMKSTKAMQIPGLGCVVQVSTQQGDSIAEAVCNVPGALIHENEDGTRCLVKGPCDCAAPGAQVEVSKNEEVRRIPASISTEVLEDLQKIAFSKNVSLIEILRQAISLEKWFFEAQSEGSRVMVERNGKLMEVKF